MATPLSLCRVIGQNGLIGQNVLIKTALQLDKRDIARLAYDTRYE